MIYTKETFYQELKTRFPNNDFDIIESYLLPILGSTTSYNNVASSEAKEKTL